MMVPESTRAFLRCRADRNVLRCRMGQVQPQHGRRDEFAKQAKFGRTLGRGGGLRISWPIKHGRWPSEIASGLASDSPMVRAPLVNRQAPHPKLAEPSPRNLASTRCQLVPEPARSAPNPCKHVRQLFASKKGILAEAHSTGCDPTFQRANPPAGHESGTVLVRAARAEAAHTVHRATIETLGAWISSGPNPRLPRNLSQPNSCHKPPIPRAKMTGPIKPKKRGFR